MSRNLLALAAAVALGFGAAPGARAEDFAGDAYGVAVQADVTYSTLTIESGAQIEGKFALNK